MFPCEMRAASGRCKAAHQRYRHTAAAEPHTAEVPPPSSRLQACRRMHELWRLLWHGHRKAPGQSVVVGEGRDALKEEVADQAMLLAEQSDKIITYEDEIIRQVHCTLYQCPAAAKHLALRRLLSPRTRLLRQTCFEEPAQERAIDHTKALLILSKSLCSHASRIFGMRLRGGMSA